MRNVSRFFVLLCVLAVTVLSLFCLPGEASANGRRFGRRNANVVVINGNGHSGFGNRNFSTRQANRGQFVILSDGTVIFVANHR